jgi:hypothetical protein
LSDFFDQTFADLGDYYPGSRRKRREPPKVKEVIPQSWEEDGVLKRLPNGNEVDMYLIGSLAKALNRPIKTIRSWMERGHLPTSPYRMPATIGKNGKEYAGRRLYSKRMVETAIDLFESAGLMSVDRVDWTVHRNLSDKITEAWDKIRAEETTTTN